MSVLQPTEYDASYFDGSTQALAHNAGYSSYKRWKRHDGVDSLGEYWLDEAKKLLDGHNLTNLKVLEIGCAKGFLVQDLNDLGVDCYGLDVSDYAINTALDGATLARPDLANKFYVGDIRTALAQFGRNEFDVVFSMRLLECLEDVDLPDVISELNRISRKQIHILDEFSGNQAGAAQYYNGKPIEEWVTMKFSKGSILVPFERKQDIRIK